MTIRLFFMLIIYLIQYLLCVWMTGLCLRRWPATADKAARLRKVWLPVLTLLVLLPVVGTLLPAGDSKFALQATGNIWLGFYLYYETILAVLLLGAALIGKIRKGKETAGPGKAWGRVLCVSLAAALVLWGYGMIHAQQPRVVTYDLNVEKQAKDGRSLKIVLVGDLHLGVNSLLSTTEKMVEIINGEKPDVVLVAGDVFTSSCKGLRHPERYAAALREIRAPQGVFAVYGNHDVEEELFGGFAITPSTQAIRSKDMEDFFRDSGFAVLEDDRVDLAGGTVLLGRIDGEKPGDGTRDRKTAAELLKNVEEDAPVLVLEHEPMEYKDLAAAGADVVLSGHTHAGQIFPGNLIIPFFNENAWGHRKLHGVDTFVTAGVGYYGPPMRVGTNSEITVINLHFRQDRG